VVQKSDDEFHRMLSDLQNRRFICAHRSTSDIEFTFKHALTQQTVCNSLPEERRKLLHERIGSALEALFARTTDDHLSELAYHYGRSLNAEKAVDYLERASRQARMRGAVKEGAIKLKQAIEGLRSTIGTTERMQREFELQAALVEMLLGADGPATDEDIIATRRLQELGEKLGSQGKLTSGLTGMSAWTPNAEFKFGEGEIPGRPDAHPLSLSKDFDVEPFEPPSFRPSQDPNLAAFSAVTAMLLISLGILYHSGLIEDVQSLLKTAFRLN
jgi:hypothetical protein